MNVVDSSGWLEYFVGGPNASFFAPAIESSDELIVPSVCVYEVFKQTLQERGQDSALEVSAIMLEGNVVELDGPLAIDAAYLSTTIKIPMADSIILATARRHDATLWTQDSDFAELEGVRYVESAS
jgi:predicted nucleic acid-binding protein